MGLKGKTTSKATAASKPALKKPANSPALKKPAAMTKPALKKPAAMTQPALKKPAATKPALKKPATWGVFVNDLPPIRLPTSLDADYWRSIGILPDDITPGSVIGFRLDAAGNTRAWIM